MNKNSETYRETQCIPGDDPCDIQQSMQYVFINKDATERMRSGKKKVRYVFEQREDIAAIKTIDDGVEAKQLQSAGDPQLVT